MTCIERITSAGAGGAPAVAEIAATNLFVLDASGWRIALHHASPVVRPGPGRGVAGAAGGQERTVDLLLRRLTTYAALAAGLLGAILALIGCAIAAIAGSAPSPGVLAAVVIGVGLAFALLARFLILRIPWFGIALLVARRVAARRAGRRGPEGP